MKFYAQFLGCCFLLTIGVFVIQAQDLHVTEAFLKADTAKIQGKCPVKVIFAGYITAKGVGTVKYTFVRSDGATSPVYTLDFKEAGTQRVTADWTLGDARLLPTYDGWQAIKILSPNELESSHETGRFSIGCVNSPESKQNNVEVFCPVKEVRTEITTPLPVDWWQTPQIGELQKVTIENIGGAPTLVCKYWAYGINVGVMRRFPEGTRECKPNSQKDGFICW